MSARRYNMVYDDHGKQWCMKRHEAGQYVPYVDYETLEKKLQAYSLAYLGNSCATCGLPCDPEEEFCNDHRPPTEEEAKDAEFDAWWARKKDDEADEKSARGLE